MTNSTHPSTVTVHHLQLLVEQDKTALAREIHDDLGGHLIATAMDLAYLKRRFMDSDADALAKIERATHSLNAAVDMIRRVTEELHPTLLDNVGLFAALRWQIRHMCVRSHIVCHDNLPDVEPRLSPATLITLFRVGQEALIVAENQPEVGVVEFSMTLEGDALQMQVSTDGAPTPPDAGSRGYVALELLRHRIDAMNGQVILGRSAKGGFKLVTQIRLDALSASDTQSVRVLEMRAASDINR